MLRTLACCNQITDITYLHSVPTGSDVMFSGELA